MDVKFDFCVHAGYSQATAKPVISTSVNEVGAGVKRSRVFIDPLTEIPRLERWFADDTHPSSYVIEKYTEELNRSPYRQRFPRLEPKNLQLWFKNHRAKMKRQRDACLAAAAAVAASNGSRRNDDGKRDNYGLGQHHQAGERVRAASGGVDPARTAFQNGEHSSSNVEEDHTTFVNGKHGGAGAFQTPAGQSFVFEETMVGGFYDQPHSGNGGGGSALDELVLRLRSGPLGRLPETTPLQLPSVSCDQ